MKNRYLFVFISITILFVVTRMVLLGAVTFAKTGPYSPDRSAPFRWVFPPAQIILNKPVRSIYLVASAPSPQKIVVLLNGKKNKTLTITPSIQEHVIDLRANGTSPTTDLSFVRSVETPLEIIDSTSPWQLWDLRTNENAKENLISKEFGWIGFSQTTVSDTRNQGGNYFKDALIKWDSGWYYSIIEDGYQFNGNYQEQQNVGFLYFYPGAAKIVKFLLGVDSSGALILTNNLFFYLSLFVIYYLSLMVIKDEYWSFLPVVLTLAHPFGIFLMSGHSEGLFFFISAVSLLLLHQKKYFLFALVGGLLGGIRPVGVIVPGLLLFNFFILGKTPMNLKKLIYVMGLALLSLWGFWVQMIFMQITFHDASLYFNIHKMAWVYPHQNKLLFVFSNLKDAFLHLDITNPEQTGFLMMYLYLVYGMVHLYTHRKQATPLEVNLHIYSLLVLILPLISLFYLTQSMGRYTLVAYPLIIVFCQNMTRAKMLFLLSWAILGLFQASIFAMRFSCWHSPF
jgi:hypothetical protein